MTDKRTATVPRREDDRARAQVVARMLIEARERSERVARDVREYQRQHGIAIETRGDYAEGSAAAYSVAGSILAGAFGTTLDDLAGVDWQPERGMAPPVLPDPDATTFAPGDTIAAATVIASRQDGDHFLRPETEGEA